ncbi:hypothetical protein SAMN05216388_102538 [Halorientalis persicus]|uniref:Uncharacterized protein n=1 Tax=Halorientalis persicus TaxID=1367881 RepID=A0A1H8U454_9EURY|nr:hypothetical protein [Halorientalis persicus]SEO97634.1 hypothetical protein SAMN05216388_102538 [Halorientalis persicus]
MSTEEAGEAESNTTDNLYSNRPEPLSEVQRQRIVRDIASWKCELERDSRSEFTHKDLVEFCNELLGLSDAQLYQRWDTTVGEWVLSRDAIVRPRTVDDETFLEYQLGLLLLGKETEYGFLNPVSIPPEACA